MTALTKMKKWGCACLATAAVFIACNEIPDWLYERYDVPGVTVESTSDNRITISWNAVQDIDRYKIYHSINDVNGTYTEIGTSNTTSYTDTGLTQNTTYYYKVAACTKMGTAGARSDAVSATLSDPDCPITQKGCPGYVDPGTAGGNQFNPDIQYASFTDSRDQKIYKSVTIGSQTWMAENLNYAVTNSACYSISTAHCDSYGRLYTWFAAMDDASSSDKVPSGVRGVCPAGWHLPSDEEWAILEEYAGGVSLTGTTLRSASGWVNASNGTDDFGFSALPGGRAVGGFDGVGFAGYWWSATELNSQTQSAGIRTLNGDGLLWNYYEKSDMLSVRCVRDSVENVYAVTFNINGGSGTHPTSQTVNTGSKITLPSQGNLSRRWYNFDGWNTKSDGTGDNYNAGSPYTPTGHVTLYANWMWSGETFVDIREGTSTTYKKVKIGSQTWMAENLNYDVPNDTTDRCYNNSLDSCAKYGRLYDWSTAMDIDKSYNTSLWSDTSVKQGVCPVGWHLPNNAEWDTLIVYVGASTAGMKLKSTIGWVSSGYRDGNGTDEYGFAALPGGVHELSNGGFANANMYGVWWSATEQRDTSADTYNMYYAYDAVNYHLARNLKEGLYSVRCVAN